MRYLRLIAFITLLFPNGGAVAQSPSSPEINGYNLLAKELWKSEPDRADSLARLARRHAARSDNFRQLALSFQNLGFISYRLGRMDSALVFFEQEALYWNRLDSTAQEGKVYNALGAIYQGLGRNRQATRYFNRALLIADTQNDSLTLAKVHNNLGVAYRLVALYDLSERHLEWAAGYYRTAGDSVRLGQVYNNMALVYMAMRQLGPAERLFREALELKKGPGTEGEQASTMHNLGIISQESGRLEEARDYFDRALVIRRKGNDVNGVISTLFSLAELELIRGDNGKSRSYLEEALSSQPEPGNWAFKERYSRIAARLAQDEGNWREAYEQLIITEQYEDSIADRQTREELADLEREQLAFMEERRLSAMKLENELQRARVVFNQRMAIVLGVLGMVLLIFLAVSLSQLKRIRLLNEKYLKEKESALASARLKTQILNNMSHEIRTPLNGIIGLSELIQDEEDSIERKLYVELQLKSAHRLLDTINAILNFAKLESGAMEVDFERIELIGLIQRTMALMQVLAREKGLALNLVTTEKDVYMLSDERMLHQILVNLVGNAIKFTDEGHVSVHVTLKNPMVEITVEDTGVGISEKYLNKIFEPFEQESGGLNRRFEGTGLGLPIAKRYAELLGGQLMVKSTLGQGSSFILLVPLNQE